MYKGVSHGPSAHQLGMKVPSLVIPSADFMSLRLATVHENSLFGLSHLLSMLPSAIFMAARNLLLLFFPAKSRFLVDRRVTSSE